MLVLLTLLSLLSNIDFMKKIKIGSYSRTVTKDGNRKKVEVKRKAVGGTIIKTKTKSFQPAVGESASRYTVDKVKKFIPSNGGEVTVKRKVASNIGSGDAQYFKNTKRARSGRLKSDINYYEDFKNGQGSLLISKYNRKGKLVKQADAYMDPNLGIKETYLNRRGVKKIISDGKAMKIRRANKK
jgi:hypothetical protein